MSDLANIALNGKPLAMHNQIEKAATAQTLEVCQHAENSVTLCPCGKPARRKFCSSAYRQAAYRESAAVTDNLKRLRDARKARKDDHIALRNASYRRLNAHRGFMQQGGYTAVPLPLACLACGSVIWI